MFMCGGANYQPRSYRIGLLDFGPKADIPHLQMSGVRASPEPLAKLGFGGTARAVCGFCRTLPERSA